jgi:CPA1 family monovalent cation:H+ antiporter
LLVGVGGVLIGLVVGWVAAWVQKRLDDPPIQITISLLTPFAAYLPAERFGVSGVLAVVTCGLYSGWRSPEILTSRMRLQAGPVWEMIVFLLNGFVFILIGLQLPEILRALSGYSIPRLIWDGFFISVAVIVLRVLWVVPATYLPRILSRKLRERDPSPPWQHVAILAWTGMRGVVSLAAAMALPLTLQDGSPFPGRPLILFFTFTVILATLVVQGLSLPPLIRWLGVEDDRLAEQEEREARLKSNEAALARLNELADSQSIAPEILQRLRIEYEDRIRQLEACDSGNGEMSRGLFSSAYEELSHELLLVERRSILQLRNERVINDDVLRRVQRDIDLAEARLRHPASQN